MYYIYYGYVGPDHHDASEEACYKLKEINNKEEVLEFHLEFQEGIHDECSNVKFIVIEGRKLELTPKEVVTEYGLS